MTYTERYVVVIIKLGDDEKEIDCWSWIFR